MKRKSRRHPPSEELQIWRSFADLMSNAFMIMSLFFIVAILSSFKDSSSPISIQSPTPTPSNTSTPSSPPLIIIDDQQNSSLRFETGKAELSQALIDHIQNKVVKEIQNNPNTYKGYIIQVIGHTDAQQVNGTSNLDNNLEKVANNKELNAINNLLAGSNADLGLMRALVVAKMLEQELPGRQIKAYSAANLYDTDGNYANSTNQILDNRKRRRIEISFTPPPAETK